MIRSILNSLAMFTLKILFSSGNDFTAAMKGDEENSSLTDKAELGLKVTR